MIDHKNKCIFIHIPRTGGTSIEGAFDIEMNYNNYAEKHLSASETRKLIGVGTWNNYYKFAIVRNPYSRLVSCWKRGFYAPRNAANLYDFVCNFKPAKHEVNSPFYHEILDIPLDYICKFESLNENFNEICAKLKLDLKLPHLEKSNSKSSYQKYYDKRTKAIVKFLYRKDLKIYDYSFEDLDSSTYLNKIQYYYYIMEFYFGRFSLSLKKQMQIVKLKLGLIKHKLSKSSKKHL